jgi:integrase
MFTYHLEAGSLQGRHPLKGLPREKGWKGRRRLGYPTEEFLGRFTRYCRPILADMLWLSFEAGGMRRGEMLFLQKTEYDARTRTLNLQADRNKNDEARVIILTEKATGIVERWSAVSAGEYVFGHPGHADGRHIPESTLWDWLDDARALAKADGMDVSLAGDPFCIHHARHGFTMSMQGVMPESWTADQLGHSSTEMIHKRYGRLRGEEAREQAREMLESRKGPHVTKPAAPLNTRVGKAPRTSRP